MYVYNDFDESFVRERVSQFRGQVARRIDGSLTEDEFKPFRLVVIKWERNQRNTK